MRKNAAPRRELTADPVYDSVLVTQFVNNTQLDRLVATENTSIGDHV